MDFKLDENLPRETVLPLKRRGHEVATVLEERMGGADDSTVFAACQQEKRVLITLDTDFSDARQYTSDASAGVIVLRLRKQSKDHVLSVLQWVLDLLDSEDINGCLWIADETRLRIRRRE